jgi:hypothetical protein
MARAFSPIADPTNESLRPSSVWTNDSTFADSAISMGSNTPKQIEEEDTEQRSPAAPKFNLSERLTELASIAWAAEQDSDFSDSAKEDALIATRRLEACFGETEQEDEHRLVQRRREEAAQKEQGRLRSIYAELAATVEAMRLRQQEQRHINELAIRKLDDVGSTCAAQEQSIKSLQEEIDRLKVDNQKLQRDNDGSQAHAEQLTSELEQKDVAIQAMSSTVAGLSGWIDSALGPGPATRRERITRGRGRFRTHYYIDVPTEGVDQRADRTVSAREVRDGISAWFRGFRDVEEAAMASTTRMSVPVQPGYENTDMSSRFGSSVVTQSEDDWGDFESPSTARFE